VSAGGTADKAEINSAIAQLDSARSALRSEAQKLSTNLSTITIRQDFTSGMINTLEDGAAELTNADMNEEGANMLMLQTRQSLGTTSLSLASQAAQSVLRLF
jgi:flagellin-like hook-associated protein FlgL